jgi:hypothetical protein
VTRWIKQNRAFFVLPLVAAVVVAAVVVQKIEVVVSADFESFEWWYLSVVMC